MTYEHLIDAVDVSVMSKPSWLPLLTYYGKVLQQPVEWSWVYPGSTHKINQINKWNVRQ